MPRLGISELLLVFAVILLLFGATRLPQLGSALGSAIRNFKRGFGGQDEVPQDSASPEKLASGSSAPTQAPSSDKVGQKSV